MGSCYNCRSLDTAEKRIILRRYSGGSQPRIVKNLPATLCRICGSTKFSGKVMAALEQIREGKATPVAYQSIPVFDLQNPYGQPQKVKTTPAPSLIPIPSPDEPRAQPSMPSKSPGKTRRSSSRGGRRPKPQRLSSRVGRRAKPAPTR